MVALSEEPCEGVLETMEEQHREIHAAMIPRTRTPKCASVSLGKPGCHRKRPRYHHQLNQDLTTLVFQETVNSGAGSTLSKE